MPLNVTALTVFVFFFALVTFVGALAGACYGPALVAEIRDYRRRQDGA